MCLSSIAALLALTLPQQADAAESATAICASFRHYDHDGDGVAEIESVRPGHRAGASGSLVLVLVEDRIGRAAPGELDLLPRCERLVDDLAAEGLCAQLLSVALAPSDLHQDGRYVLALRELLRAFAREGELRSVVLVGHFPDAFLVRTCNWRKRGDVVLRKGRADAAVHRGVHYLRRVPEDVAHKADIVLADLDGRWQDLYVQPRTGLPAVTAVYAGKIPAAGGACVDLERRAVVYEDFFHVSDGKLEISERLDADGAVVGHALFLDDRSGDHECSPEDRTRPNRIARPEILVSRIDARGTAMQPRSDVVGVAGRGLLDEHGRPQAVSFDRAEAVPDPRRLWQHDAALERRLLAEYLDRNHGYRTGAFEIAWRPASVAHGLGSGYREMSKAATDWLPRDAELSDVREHATLERVAAWLAFPAVLRTVRAHSDAAGSVFERSGLGGLHARLGGPAWSWTRQGKSLVPSLASACRGGRLGWHLLHSLWRNTAVAPEPCFYHHTGCHGISPPGARRVPFDDPAYGRRQGAEALLLFGNGLALVGRSKVFYDEPRGFAAALAEGASFGAAWARYHDLESRASSYGAVGGDIGRKRSYFWSVIGDCTLRLSTRAPGR